MSDQDPSPPLHDPRLSLAHALQNPPTTLASESTSNIPQGDQSTHHDPAFFGGPEQLSTEGNLFGPEMAEVDSSSAQVNEANQPKTESAQDTNIISSEPQTTNPATQPQEGEGATSDQVPQQDRPELVELNEFSGGVVPEAEAIQSNPESTLAENHSIQLQLTNPSALALEPEVTIGKETALFVPELFQRPESLDQEQKASVPGTDKQTDQIEKPVTVLNSQDPSSEPFHGGQKMTEGSGAVQTEAQEDDAPASQAAETQPAQSLEKENEAGSILIVPSASIITSSSETLPNRTDKPETNPSSSGADKLLSVTGIGAGDNNQPANGEQEIARWRDMSLSMDSNFDASIEPSFEKQSAPIQSTVSAESSTLNLAIAPSDLPNSNDLMASAPTPDSPQTATLLKFPLPVKQAADQGTPLFTSSPPPPPPVTKPATRSPPRQPVLSRIASLKQRVEKDPMDGEAWIELIADAEKKGDLEKTREVYHSFLQNFPDAANQWIAYADLELGHGHFPEVEQIFSRCLRSSVSVDLWAFYLNYIRRVNPVEGDKAAASRAIIISAYDFSLNHIGIDHESGKIWLDYINIVKSGEATGTWQEQQKMDSLRKLYQRAVCVPLDNIEQLWKDYDQFEHQMSKMTAKKFLADKSAQYLVARSALKEMKTLTSVLLRPKVPVKPNWRRVDDHKQVKQWKEYLRWEESNPLELQDKNMLNSRIQYAYRQAIMHMRFHPEIWYQAVCQLQKIEKPEEALAIIQAGLVANPTSIVLTYTLVEAQENLKNYPACYAAFDSLIEYYHSEVDEINKTIEKEIANGIPIIESKTGAQAADAEVGQELTEEEKQRAKEEEKLRANITALYKPKIDELREAAASVWITEMRFARRTEGIKPARAVFTRARKSPCLTRHVFEASAMMEYHWNKEASVATKVFDLGLKSFSEDVDYVLQYLSFLITLNDESNARALFEKTVSKIPPEAARPLWDRWAAYEFIYGDRTANQKLESRMVEHFPDWGVVDRLFERHNYHGLQDVLGRELGTAVEPIPLRRSPSPVPAHLEGFGFKRTQPHDSIHPGQIPSGPANHRARQTRERSFSPDFRGKRARAPRNSPSPDRRNGGVQSSDHTLQPPNKRGRDLHENVKRNRYVSPPRGGRISPSPQVNQVRENPYGWFPDKLRYFLSILPTAASFDGPRLDANTILQVLSDSNIPTTNTNLNNMNNLNNGNNSFNKTLNNRDGFNNNNNGNNHVQVGWGTNRGGGNNLQQQQQQQQQQQHQQQHNNSNLGGGRSGSNNRRGRRK